jgi:hypothetical protein
VLPGILTSLRPATLSPPLQRAFELAAARRFVELLIEEPVPAVEEGVRAALRGLAQLGIGDASSAAVQFQRAQLLGTAPATTRVLSGAARAMQSRDADAISAWQDALAAGAPRALVVPHLLGAYLRRNDMARATPLLADVENSPATWPRNNAAVLIATQKQNDAAPLIEARLATVPTDTDAQWLLLHALFARLVNDKNSPAAVRERFTQVARAYIDARGSNAALAQDWLAAIASF